MPAPHVKRLIVYRWTERDDGRRQTIYIDRGAELVCVHLTNGERYLVPTGTVEWDGDVPIEVWVPADRYGDWKMAQWGTDAEE